MTRNTNTIHHLNCKTGTKTYKNTCTGTKFTFQGKTSYSTFSGTKFTTRNLLFQEKKLNNIYLMKHLATLAGTQWTEMLQPSETMFSFD